MTEPHPAAVAAGANEPGPTILPETPGSHSSASEVDVHSFRPVRPGLQSWAVAAAALLAVLVPLVATLDLDVPGRSLLAVAYVFLVPGVPLAFALRLPSALVTAALAIASSLAVAILYGTVTLVGGWWQPVTGAWIITLLALVLSVLVLRQPSPAEPQLTADSGAARPRPSGRRAQVTTLLPWALVISTALVWWWSTQHLDLDRAAALGLLPVAGWRFGVAVAMVSALTAHALLRRPLDHLLLAACALLIALMGYATVAVGDGAGSVPVGWVHVAFAQYIGDNGVAATGVDARFSWPGFFSAAAQLTELAGTEDTRGFLVLASVVSTMAVLPALLLLGRAITRSWRSAWLGVFVYLVTNWYQQDYFSPQATAFVLYTTVLGTLLWLVSGSAGTPGSGRLRDRARYAVRRVPAQPAAVTPAAATGLGLVLALLVAAVVLGHQLTPMTLTLSLLVFAVTGQTRYRMLWFFSAVLFAGWFSYGATDYWFGHLDNVLGDLGQFSSSVQAGVSDRLVGDPVYRSAQFVRIGWSGALVGGAALGLFLLRRRPEVWLLAGLAGAPFALLALQSYGGEGVIRSLLYASPVLAPLCAMSLQATATWLARRSVILAKPSWRATALVALVVALAVLLLTFTRGLNASFERTPQPQVAASEVLLDRIRPGDVVGLPSPLGLTPALELKKNSLAYLDLEACDTGDLQGCLGEERPRFVLLTLTQERNGELRESRPPGWLWRLGDQLIETGGYRLVYDEPTARLLETDEGAPS